MSRALGLLGLTYSAVLQPGKAIEYFEQALAICEETNDRSGQSIHLNHLGFTHADLGDMHKALSYHEQALEIARDTDEKDTQANCLGNLGNVWTRLGQSEKGIEYHEQALAIFRELADRRNEGVALGSLGDDYAATQNTQRAIEYYEQATGILRDIGANRFLAENLYSLGKVNQYIGNREQANRCSAEALALKVTSSNYGCAINLGLLKLEEGKTEEALEHLTRGMALCEELLDKAPNLFEQLCALALAQLGVGRPNEALASYRRALNTCSAKGVLRNALRELEILGRSVTPVAGLVEAVDLLKNAIGEI